MTHREQVTDGSTAFRSRRWVHVAIWILTTLVVIAFGTAGFLKASGQPKMVEEFGKLGLGQGFRYVTAAIELSGAVLLIWPRTAFLGSLLLLSICAGALVAQLGPLHGDIVHVFIFAAAVAILAWFHRPRMHRHKHL